MVRLLPSGPGLAQDVLDHVAYVGGDLVSETLADHPQPSEWVWRLSNGSLLRYVEDSAFNAKYVVFEGADAAESAATFRATVPCWDIDQIAERWDASVRGDSPEELVDLISAIGLLAPERSSPAIVARFRAALEHAEPAVRLAAVFAAQLPRWPELFELLRGRARRELHPSVQETVDAALVDAPPT